MQRDFYSNLLVYVHPCEVLYSDILGIYSELRASMRIFSRRSGVFLAGSGRHLVRFLPANGRISARSRAGLGDQSVPVTAPIRPAGSAFLVASETKSGTSIAAAASERHASGPQAVCLRAAFAGGSRARFGCTEFVRVCTVFVRFPYGFARKSANLCAWKARKRRSKRLEPVAEP